MKLCIVEDDRLLAQTLEAALAPEECQLCCTEAQALRECRRPWDLVLLDVRLPDGNGLEVARAIRLFSDVPILFLSSDERETTMLEAFEAGCDDYIVKPVRLAVLRQKVKALLHRSGCRVQLELDSVILFPEQRSLEKGELRQDLSPSETAILRVLFLHSRHRVSMAQLQRGVFADTGREMSPETFSSRIWGLKRKLAPFGLRLDGRRSTGFCLERL